MLLLAVLLFGDSSHVVQLAVSPQESVSVTVAGAGAGEPVVLVPGLFGSAFGYRHLIPLLVGAGYQAIVFEPLGVGTSARPERADYSLSAQAERLATVLDTLRVRQAVIIGHDIGAAIAFRLAYRRPDLVRAIVSLEGGPAEAAATPGFRRAMRFAPWIKMFGGYGRVRREIRRSLVASSGDTSWVSDAVVDGYTTGAAHNFDGTLKAYVRMAHAREPERLVPHLAEILCPVRLVVGSAPHSGGIPAAEVRVLAARLPAFTVDTVSGAGHFLYEEQPQAVFAAIERAETAPARLPK